MTRQMEKCEGCYYFAKTHYSLGECRRHAPVFYDVPPQHQMGDMPQRRWPRTGKEEWCGDFEAATQP